MPSGILLLDKTSGLTSNAALTRVKCLLGVRKAGHTGALDPMATGLLPLCFGEATKISGFLLDSDKGYEAGIVLGLSTDSGDADGRVVAERDVPEIDAVQFDRVLDAFRGTVQQVPPMVSALKVKGRRLYELAREGIEVERQPRTVQIHRLELLELALPRVRIRVECSKGTYIRSLAMDIGERLGCGAHLDALRRTRSGPFRVQDALTLEVLESMTPQERAGRLLPPDAALPEWPRIALDTAQCAALRQGRKIAVGHPPAEGVRLYHEGVFQGLGSIDAAGWLRVRRLFHPD